MQISVVVTTFNGQSWVRPQIVSIVTQTRRPDQLIVCDDGSSDDTLQLVEAAVAGSGVEVAIIENSGSRLGTIANLQRGLDLAAGGAIALADQDDIWVPQRLETIEPQLRAGADAVFSDGRLIDDAGEAVKGTLWERAGFNAGLQNLWKAAPLRVLARRNVVTGAALAFRSTWLDAILPIDTPMWHDAWIALIITALGGRINADEGELIHYRLHQSNAVGLPATYLPQRLWTLRHEGLRHAETADHFARGARRVRALGDPAATARWLEEVSEFWASRELRGSVTQRVRAASRTYRRGDYRRYSSGWRAMVLDLLSSPDAS